MRQKQPSSGAAVFLWYTEPMKIIQIVLLVLIIIGLGLIFTQKMWVPGVVEWIIEWQDGRGAAHDGDSVPVADYKKGTYRIDGQSVVLGENGTAYFGNEVRTDLNADGRDDVVFLFTQQPGGSGTFYYVAAALNTPSGYVGSHALFLGDRIAPQVTFLSPRDKKIVVVAYADRKPGESFAVQPSVGKSIQLLLDANTMQFGEVVADFEGEADPNRMSLTMKPWTWVESLYNDGRTVKPTGTRPFVVTFVDKERFSATTDCNSVGGLYTAGKGTIAFNSMISTKMFCEGSQEQAFTTMLTNSTGYHFTSKGELVLDLKFDSGSVIFR